MTQTDPCLRCGHGEDDHVYVCVGDPLCDCPEFVSSLREEAEALATLEDSPSIVPSTDTSELVLTDEQQRIVDNVLPWALCRRSYPPMDDKARIVTIGGYAGTGKTTMIKAFVKALGRKAAVCAFTGKAAYVLRSKGVDASTVHRLIYKPQDYCIGCEQWMVIDESEDTKRCPFDPKHKFTTRFRRLPFIDPSIVIVDEASMLNADLFSDLLEYHDVKLILVGDHGQLEPIGENPNLMRDPDHRLETIHRQAEDSPIPAFAHHVRMGNRPKTFGEAARVVEEQPKDLESYDVILCGYNKTRVAANGVVRRRRGFEGDLPEVGERVVCLRNSREHGVFNGMLGTVRSISAIEETMSVVDDVGVIYQSMPIAPQQFGHESTMGEISRRKTLWDFGYALTVHKSQGSQYDRVLVLEQIARSWSAARWRYTAATRAAKQLVYCVR